MKPTQNNCILPITLLTIFGTILLVTLGSANPGINTRQYGAVCNNNAECTGEPYLECGQNKTCECQGKGNMTHEDGESCLLFAGASCANGAPCFHNSQCNTVNVCECDDGISQEDGFCVVATYGTECVDNEWAFCDYEVGLRCDYATRVCVCTQEGTLSDWSETEGRCVRRDKYEEPCDVDADCVAPDPDESLKCLPVGDQKKCICSDSTMAHPDGGKCFATVGNSCAGDQTCFPNTHCEGTPGTCSCDPGFIELPKDDNFGNKCWATWGTECGSSLNPNFTTGSCDLDNDLLCNPDNLLCTCIGERAGQTEWSEEFLVCLRLVGVPCDLEEDRCAPHATCVVRLGEVFVTSCECDAKYTKTEDSHCQLGINSTCTSNPTAESEKCNADESLVCSTGGTCACNEDSVYAEGDKCLTLIGGDCDLGAYGHFDRTCLPELECFPKDGNNTEVGVCGCKDGLSPLDRATCGAYRNFSTFLLLATSYAVGVLLNAP